MQQPAHAHAILPFFHNLKNNPSSKLPHSFCRIYKKKTTCCSSRCRWHFVRGYNRKKPSRKVKREGVIRRQRIEEWWILKNKIMECVFGLVGNGFAIVAADSSAVHSILVHKSNEDKIMVLDSHKLIAASGEPGDRVQFTEYIQKNVALYQFRNGIPLTTAAAANFTRGELATALRKNPYSVNILMAGYDKETGPSLYYVDYIATLHKVEKGAFGYGSYFSLSMMDRHYHSGMSVEEAIDLVDKCIVEIRSRLVVAPPNFVIKIVDKDGAREVAWRQSIKDTGDLPV